MHIGDRHPQTNFEAVDIGHRRYQVGTSRAFAAAVALVEEELGVTFTDHQVSMMETDEATEAFRHNAEVVRAALEIAHGRKPAAGLPT